MANKKIKAVLFDLGDTLVNFGKVSTTWLFRQGARLSYDFLKSLGQPVGSFRYYYWRNLMALRIRHWLSNITKKDFNSLLLLRGIGTKKGIKLDRQQWQHFAWLWYEPLSKIGRAEPNIAETLSALRKMSIKLGIVSNTFVNGASLNKHLQQVGILDFFPVRVYSYEFDFRKPDARIFKVAAERIGEKTANILFVGDRIDKDINAASKAGMQTVLKKAYTNSGKKIPKGVWKINQLCELPALIEKNNIDAS
ncbi:HAD family hydrolase [Planctomycetota bacterium]